MLLDQNMLAVFLLLYTLFFCIFMNSLFPFNSSALFNIVAYGRTSGWPQLSAERRHSRIAPFKPSIPERKWHRITSR